MRTSVASQKIVTVAMSVEEWAEWLENPKTLLVQIENLALAAELEPQRANGHSPLPRGHKVARTARKAPKGRTARASGTGRVLMTCPECPRKFKYLGYLERHMARVHAPDAKVAGD